VTFGGRNTQELQRIGVQTVVLPHGVFVPESVKTVRHEYEVSRSQTVDRPIVLFSQGRLVRDKGMDIVCEVAHTVSLRMQRQVELLLLGDGPEAEPLQKLVSRRAEQNPLFSCRFLPF
jgi:glycosyltransferase involved in cell wall biosynthesis